MGCIVVMKISSGERRGDYRIDPHPLGGRGDFRLDPHPLGGRGDLRLDPHPIFGLPVQQSETNSKTHYR